LANGEVWCWGRNEYGQLGEDPTIVPSRPTPASVEPLFGAPTWSDVTLVSAGGLHTCALDTNGDVWCWGYGRSGQLGEGSVLDRYWPVRAWEASATGVRTVAIAAGLAHTCSVLGDGGVACWGNNTYGQVGDGTGMGDVRRPVRVVW
jgi:alpha-tubulin suppressor-like RCC1 family protein